MTKETPPQFVLTATGFAASEALAVLRKHNVAIAPLLLRAGLNEGDFPQAASDDAPSMRRVSAIGQCKLLDYAADAMNDSAFGLHLAARIDPRDVGIVFYAGSAASDLGEALAFYSRYCRIVNQAFRLKLIRRPDDGTLEMEFVGLPRYAARHYMEFVMGGIRTALRTITGRNVTPKRIAFAHNRNSNLQEFERFFGCPVEFGAPNNMMVLSTDTLRIPLITADPKLLRALQPFCDAAAKERNATSGTLRAAVEKEVEKLLPSGKANAETVAAALALGLRTFARRLAEEGTTYGEVVDQLRRSLALQYLKDPSMTLAQIAWLLGYEGSTSFNHAFKRWTGRSPSAVRRQGQLGAPA